MLTVEEALTLVAEHAQPLAPRRLPLAEAAGQILAEDITSDVNSPPYDKALMDGYAVRSADRDPHRHVLEEIAAGGVPHFPLTPGSVSRIMTGAPLPEGADAVVPVEQTDSEEGSSVRILKADVAPGQNLLRLGASMRAGDVVLRTGATLRPIEIGVLAEIGRGMVNVVPRPRVAVLPTGNELVPVGERPAIGQIRNSNGPMLLAAAVRANAEATELGIARDTRDELARLIKQGLQADILVLSGGVSAGKFDLVPSVLAELGVEQVFHKIAMRPGKPLWFGIKQDGARRVLVFALPGNPVSSLVCFELFARPTIDKLAGRGFVRSSSIQARLGHAFSHAGGRESYLPATVSYAVPDQQMPLFGSAGRRPNDEAQVNLLPWQGSADVVTLARANALARFSHEKQELEAGALIEVLLI